jgi:hypothetical protein
MAALTRSMSAATSPTSGSIEAFCGLAKGTITATLVSTFAEFALSFECTIESAAWGGKGREAVDNPQGRPIAGGRRRIDLQELVRTNDLVLISAVGALLDGANIHHVVLDQNMSIVEGSLGLLQRRILVNDDDNDAARQLLTEAGLGYELRDND